MNRFPNLITGLKKLDIDMRDTYQYFYCQSNSQLSNSLFNHRICWNEGFDYYYIIMDDYLCLVADDNIINKAHLVFPLGRFDIEKLEKIVLFWKDAFSQLSIPFRIDFIDKAACTQLQTIFTKNNISFTIVPETECYDYLYKVDEICNLSGRNNKFKRSAINQASHNNTSVIQIMPNSKEALECRRIDRLWKEWKQNEQNVSETDDYALQFYWDNSYRMDALCYALVINGIIEAYFVASIYQNTLTFHFAKSNRQIRYANFVLQYFFLKNHIPDNIIFVNHEDDMNLSGIKYYKDHLGRYTLIEKYSMEL